MSTSLDTRIEVWMSRSVITVEVDASVGHAARMLMSKMISCVVVLEGSRAVGMVTERDLVMCAAVHGVEAFETMSVIEIMGKPLVAVRPDASLREVVLLAIDSGIRHVAVLTPDARLVGIVTQSDLMRACAERAGLIEGRD